MFVYIVYANLDFYEEYEFNADVRRTGAPVLVGSTLGKIRVKDVSMILEY